MLFERMYICFAVLKKGYKERCRPILGTDDCHLKGSQKGKILSFVGTDVKNGIYPIAFIVVDRSVEIVRVGFLRF